LRRIYNSIKRHAETTTILNGNKEEWERNSGKKISQQKLADEFGKGQDWISRYLAVASLDNGVKEELMGISISFEICSKYIIPLKDTQKQFLLLSSQYPEHHEQFCM